MNSKIYRLLSVFLCNPSANETKLNEKSRVLLSVLLGVLHSKNKSKSKKVTDFYKLSGHVLLSLADTNYFQKFPRLEKVPMTKFLLFCVLPHFGFTWRLKYGKCP